MIKNAYFGLFLVFVFGTCIYVFESGLPQPTDFLIGFLILVLATGYIVRPVVHKDLYLAGGLFLGYVALVNLFWYAQYFHISFLLSTIYYTFNLATFIVIISLIGTFGQRFIVPCRVALFAAATFEALAVLVWPEQGAYRQVGTFNNPNQLGYWSLLIAVCWLVLRGNARLTLIDLAMLCICAYLAANSLSKAATIGFGLLVLLACIFQGMSRPMKAAMIALIFLSTVVTVMEGSVVERVLSTGLTGKVADRLGDIGGQDDDSLAARGYDRMWRHPEHLSLGAGEGGYWRFSAIGGQQREMHSSLGTILFCYGMVGFSLFLFLLYVVFRRAPFRHLMYSLPIWAYGITHQGVRFSMFWVSLALVFGMAHYIEFRPRQVRQRQPDPDLVPQRLRPRGAD